MSITFSIFACTSPSFLARGFSKLCFSMYLFSKNQDVYPVNTMSLCWICSRPTAHANVNSYCTAASFCAYSTLQLLRQTLKEHSIWWTAIASDLQYPKLWNAHSRWLVMGLLSRIGVFVCFSLHAMSSPTITIFL